MQNMKTLITLIVGIILGLVIALTVYFSYAVPYHEAELKAGQVFELSAYYQDEASLLNKSSNEVRAELVSRQCSNLEHLAKDLDYFQSQDNQLGEIYVELIEGKISIIKRLHSEADGIECTN